MNRTKCDNNVECREHKEKKAISHKCSFFICFRDDKTRECECAESYGGSPDNPYGYFCKCPIREQMCKEYGC